MQLIGLYAFCVYVILLQPYPQQEETSLSFGPRFTLLTTRSTAERVYYLFGMAGMGLLDKASLVGLVSDLGAFSALITAIIVNIVAS